MNYAQAIASDTYSAIITQVADFTRELSAVAELPEGFSLSVKGWYWLEAQIDAAVARDDPETTRRLCDEYKRQVAGYLSKWRAMLSDLRRAQEHEESLHRPGQSLSANEWIDATNRANVETNLAYQIPALKACATVCRCPASLRHSQRRKKRKPIMSD